MTVVMDNCHADIGRLGRSSSAKMAHLAGNMERINLL